MSSPPSRRPRIGEVMQMVFLVLMMSVSAHAITASEARNLVANSPGGGNLSVATEIITKAAKRGDRNVDVPGFCADWYKLESRGFQINREDCTPPEIKDKKFIPGLMRQEILRSSLPLKLSTTSRSVF